MKRNLKLSLFLVALFSGATSLNAQLEVQTSGDVQISKNLTVTKHVAINGAANTDSVALRVSTPDVDEDIRTFGVYSTTIALRNKTGNKYLPILENTSWTTISYYFEPPTMASVYTNIGDTLIGEKKHTIIKQYVINVNDATVYPDVNPSVTTVYLYEDTESKRVYQYDESHKRDVLMYDFSVQIGDKMPIDPIRHMTSDTLFVLKDISDIENSGYTRKQFTFVYGESDSIIWVEGIGNYTNFTIPYAIKHSEISRILCVQKDNNTVYDTGTFKGKTCEDIKEIFDDNYSAIPETKYVNPPAASKILRDGHILIIRDNKTFTLTGQPVE